MDLPLVADIWNFIFKHEIDFYSLDTRNNTSNSFIQIWSNEIDLAKKIRWHFIATIRR